MLKFLRKKGVMKKILWVVAVVIIVSFGFFGTANYMSGTQKNYAGTIFGRRVSFEDFRESLRHARNQAILQYGEQFNQISQFLDLEQEAWDRLILLHEARKRNIRIPDTEVREAVQQMPFFQTDGQFDPARYQQIVKFVFRCTPRQFEEGIRHSLIFAKLFEEETEAVTVSDEELRQAYQEKNQQAQVDYVLFSSEQYTPAVEITEDQAKQYFEENKEYFRRPPQVNAEYIYLPFADGMTEKQKDDLITLTGRLVLALEDKPDLPAAASQFGLEVKESGYFSADQVSQQKELTLDVMQKALALEPGETSEPIETARGFYIIKVKEKKPSSLPTFEEVKAEVTAALKEKEAALLAKQNAETFLQGIRNALAANPQQGFVTAAEGLGHHVRQTEPFRRGDYITGIGIAREFQQAAFALKADQRISEVVATPVGFCVLHLKSFQDIDEETYQKEKEAFRQQLLVAKKNMAFRQFLANLRAKANLESNLARPDEFPAPAG